MLNKRIIQELSREFKLPEHIIEKVVRHPYKYQLGVMKNGELRPFRHPFLGVFGVKPGRLKYIKDKNADKP